KTPKTGITKTTPQHGESEHGKKQQTKTTKHTIEFSNNTSRPTAQEGRGEKPRSLVRAAEIFHRSG
ncbi:MAG: hypothetical protein SW019_25915, partial [Actinomycetota bacterium]|nr:hypothetical protein [Actinomycetota bacterium]